MNRLLLALIVICVAALTQSALAADTVYYYYTDTLHSAEVVTDANGNVVERTYYAPYGQVLNRPMRNGPGYSGHEEDPATGLVYMQQRYYDAQSGRFLSTDPVQPTDNGQNFNRYWYAEDNPYRYTDPDGRQDADAYARLRQAQQTSGVPMTLVKMGNNWQPVPTAVAANVMLAQASGTTLGQYTAPPTRQGTARAMDKVSVGATAVAVATAADAPPVAAAAGVVDEAAATLAFALDPTPARALNVATVGALGALKVAAKGSAEAAESVHNLEKATQANTLLNAAMPPSVSPAQRVPAPPPPPPPSDKDH